MQAQQKPHTRLGCSTISFRHLALDEALAQITGLGFDDDRSWRTARGV